MTNWRCVRILLIVLLVLAPVVLGALVGSGVVNQAAGAPGDTWTITASAGSGGSISPSGTVTVNDGADQAFTITPNAHYHIVDVLVDGVSKGPITAYTFPAVSADGHTISASFAITTHNITASAGSGGSISPSGTVTVNDGADQAFTITPNAHYHIVDVLVDGVSKGPITAYTFPAVSADGHTISASFAITTHNITASAGSGGSISPSGTVTVNDGADQAFTITPNAHYHIVDVLVDGVSKGPITAYTFPAVSADGHTISASFAITTHNITASAGSGGSISPSGTVTVNDGADQAFTITPNAHYHIVDVLVDGVSKGPITAYTFPAVSADGHTISASFAITTHNITASAGSGGSISPSGTVTVNDGADQAFTITPNAHYHIVDVLVDGVSKGPITAYTFPAVSADGHTISASFAITTHNITASAGSGGSISPSGTVTVNDGADQAFTITAATGYHVSAVTVDGSPVTMTGTNAYTFPAVSANHTITVSFAIDTFTLTPSAGANGTISPATVQTVNYGATPTFTFAPATGYHVSAVTVDGSPVTMTGTNAYTFPAVAANHTITVSFAIDTFTLTPSAGANGTISPATVQTVNYGATPTFAIKAAPDYYVADVLVDGVSVGPVTRYTFTAVAADHTISASFAVGVQTRLSISVAKTIVTYGGSTMLTGTLYNSADPLHEVSMGAQPVTVQTSSSTAGPWVDLKTLTTSSLASSVGTCTLTVAPTGATYYRLYFAAAADSGYGSVLSYFVRVSVRPVLGTPKVPLSVRAGRSFTVQGTLRPHWPAGQKTVTIEVYRYTNRRWTLTRQVSATNADSDGNTNYGAKVKLTAKGRYRFQAYTPSTMTWVGVTTRFSTVLTIR